VTPPSQAAQTEFQPTKRTKIKRLHQRAVFDRKTVYEVLDAGLLCHVGYVIDGQPYVTPTAYWRVDDRVYWHGSSVSKMLKAVEKGIAVCFTVALMDGLVIARSGYNSSINYRTVMALGRAEKIAGEADKLAALEVFADRLAPGLWADQRPVNKQEIKATAVLTMKLEEVACKIRGGPPGDEEEDYALDIWAGVVPISTAIGAPIDDPRLKDGLVQPAYLKNIRIG